MEIVWFSFWFFLPAALANAAPVLVARLPGLRRWNAPIDGGQLWHGRPVLGSHKTWRGLLAGLVVATITLWAQQGLAREYYWGWLASGPVDYRSVPVLVLGPLFGLGALAGDAVKSWFKRRLAIPSGHSWAPFDQIDYIVGGLAASLLVVVLPLSYYAVILVIWFLAHLVVSYLGWRLGLKERPI